jgi:cephalosporin hydroxylase
VIVRIDTDRAVVALEDEGGTTREIPFSDPEAFEIVSNAWLRAGWDAKHVYRFSWLGRPIIQLPEDIVRLQELVFRARPDVVVETGIAHGGSLVLHASVLEVLGRGRVVGVDVEIRPQNRSAIEAHPLAHRITLIEGDSVDPGTFARVRGAVGGAQRVLVVLDSKHTKEHVLAELRLYGDLVSPRSYLVVADGIMRDLAGAPRASADWTWNNPRAAVDEFLAESDAFVREEPAPPFDESNVQSAVTYFGGGWLRRTR